MSHGVSRQGAFAWLVGAFLERLLVGLGLRRVLDTGPQASAHIYIYIYM